MASLARPRNRRISRYIFLKSSWRGAIYLIAIAIMAVSVLPLLWTLSTSFKQGFQVMELPPKLIPDSLFVQNYRSVFEGFGGLLPVSNWLRNSIFLSVVNIFGEVLFASIAGYGFARFRFRGRNLMFIAMLGSAVVPQMVRLLPQYMLFSKVGMTNTYAPLILPNWFGGVFLTFLFRQHFVTIPRDLDDAARVDGASNIAIFTKIMLPLSKPVLATAAILVFFHNWNDFLGPFIYLHTQENYTLAVGLRFIQASGYTGSNKEPLLAAYAMLMALPLITVFFVFQRYFVRDLQLSASKEA
jgi:multiple sugar transport system permease protein